MKMELTDNSLITRSDSISWCDMGEEVVVLRVSDQAYYRLRDSARALWLHLEQPHSLRDLVKVMELTYEAAPAEIALQTRAFVAECAELELVRLANVDP